MEPGKLLGALNFFNVFEKDNDFLDKPQYVTSQHIDEFGYTSDQNHQHIIFTAKPQK